MDVRAPMTAAANLDGGLLNKIVAFVETAKSAAADGITWAEFGELVVALLKLVVAFLDTVSTLTGAEKKALALDAVAGLFDAVADKAVPTLAWPIWILARPAVRALVLALASGAIEQLLPLVRSVR
jgi:hypothetical protein